jgi:hypothetical protein
MIASASRIFCADGALEPPKLECDSSATLGFKPKRLQFLRGEQRHLGQLIRTGSRFTCVSQMKSCRPGRISICNAASVLTPGRGR